MNRSFRTCIAASVAVLASTAAHAQVMSSWLGTDAPPTTLHDYTMQDGWDVRASGTDVRSAFVGSFRTVDFSRTMTLHRIGDGWLTWSHGYAGPVYGTDTDSVRLHFDDGEVGAFILYVEPSFFGEFRFEVSGFDSTGRSSNFVTDVEGFEGAQGFGFSAPAGGHITEIRVVNTDGNASGFAVGEFSSAPVATECLPWRPFSFGDEGDIYFDTINVGTNCGLLQVTDAFASGDRFNVRVFRGASQVASFNTSPPRDGEFTTDYDDAFASRSFSSGATVLDPGLYRVQITVLDSPFGSGGAALKLGQRPCSYGDCRADFDGDGELTIFDFLAFQNAFDDGSFCADFDGDTRLTLFDLLAFQNEFDAGC